MTIATGCAQMLTDQCKLGTIMFKDRISPGFLSVTAFTTIFAKPLVDFVFVGIPVAGDAFPLDKAELVERFSRISRGFAVTLIAGNRQVSADKRKCGGIVLRDSKVRRPETCDRMTAFTGATGGPPREFPIVEIAVAVAAVGESRHSLPLLAMTLGTRKPCMLPSQRIARFVMIELLTLHLAPAGGRMATSTLAPQAPLMHIAMAIVA